MPNKVNQTHREWHTIKRSNGMPATGVDPGDAVITIRNPADDASTIAALVESALGGGLYYFDIPAAFTLAHGPGSYGVLVDIDSNSPKVRDIAGGGVPFFLVDLEDVQATAALALDSADEVHQYLALEAGVPRVDTPTSIDVGDISQTVDVAGSTVTTTRT